MTGDAVRWTRSEFDNKSSTDHSLIAKMSDSNRWNEVDCICSKEFNKQTKQTCVAGHLHCTLLDRHVYNKSDRRNKQWEQEGRSYLFSSFSHFLVLISGSLRSGMCRPRESQVSLMRLVVAILSIIRSVSMFCRCDSFGSKQRVFFKRLLVILQIYALSSSLVIAPVYAANEISTSRDNRVSSDENSAYDHFGSSDLSDETRIDPFTPTWAVHIPDGDESGKADEVARDHGFINLGKIIGEYYHFHHNTISKRSLEASHYHQQKLESDARVRWSEQQRAKLRIKRDFIRMRPSRTSSVSGVELNDPKWSQMWYLNRGKGLDMNVIPAWEQGITGKGVVVTILDDGLESDHPDLEHNYDPKASYDVNSHDEDPMPHYDMTDSNRHGTRCAGEVAATANNSLCSVGIAFGARVGGVRMLDGDVTDAVEARSLSLNPQHIDIYSASWGPDDDGKTVDGPGELATRAFIEGVTKGRGGKGSIFIWASGNGGRELDNCNCDGYTNSIWTLSISSATEEGHVPWYSEKCSSTLATTYSSGGQSEKQVVTTDLHHSCTTSHTGTSASAPLAAGIAALALEANRNLTWRDLQHIVVRTAKPGNLKDPTWTKNGVGRRVSHSFGYGLMDAAAMVKLARTWQTVPEQQRCEINAPHVEQMIPAKRYVTLQLTVKHCMGVNFLEHVQAKISLTSQRRGDIVIYLQSPSGTRVTLLTSRVHDVSRSGFNEWPFMSVHTWGEAPHGNWLLEVHNEGRFSGYAVLKSWSLIFYGTAGPADRNDPVPIRPTVITPMYSSTSQIYQSPFILPNSNKYPTSILTKPNFKGKTNQSLSSSGGVATGRKQQQPNHKISPYGIVLSTPKKNGKNSKNNAQNSGGKANNKGNTTNRPQNSQISGQHSNKNNFYRLPGSASSGKSSSTGNSRQSSTTARPKYGSQQLAYNANIGPNRSSNVASLYKPEKSRVHEKIAIKAPKQIKDNNAYGLNADTGSSTTGPTPLPPSQSRYETDNSYIPPRFQKYEKIEQIYPEFHPYTGGSGGLSRDNISPTKPAPNKKQYPYYPNVGGTIQDGNGSSNRGRSNNANGNRNHGNERVEGSSFVVVTNPKPSRENSKKFSSTLSSSSSSSSLSSSSSMSSSASSSQNFPNEERDKQTEGIYIPNRKNTKAQISQWDLIFYGTETPPQPNDPIQIRPGGNFGSYGGDLDNNFLDSDPETMSQWRDVQQAGESHVDVQRTTNDQTNTACTNFIADQRCIECLPGTFLYKERCWSHCPEQSYMVPEVPRNKNRYINNNDDQELLTLRSIPNNTPEEYPFPTKRAIMFPVPQKKCAACHLSCLLCRGPAPSHCLQCHPGDHLTIISSDETYCGPSTNGNNLSRATGQLAAGDDADDGENILKDLNAFWSIILPAIVIICLIVVINIVGCRKNQNHSYERVAFSPLSEETEALNPGAEKIVKNFGEGPSSTQSQRILVESSSDSDDC